ncbi:MAG: hypothetical protein ACPG1C_02505 [Alphaproteobacteria bacterium]
MSSQGCAISARAGDCYEFAQAKRVRQVRDEQTITAAWDKLNRMMGEGKFPAPVSDYRVEAIRYNPRFMGLNGDTKSVLAVEQVPSGPDSGTIIAFAPAAETLEHAVRCLAHELFRFHPTQGENHDLCYQYAQAAVRVYNGGKYNGPDVGVEELGADLEAGFDAEADADLPPTTSQAASTPTPNPRPDREADTEVPTPSPSPNPRPDKESDDAAARLIDLAQDEKVAETRAERQANFEKARMIVDWMIAEGHINDPAPGADVTDVHFEDEDKIVDGFGHFGVRRYTRPEFNQGVIIIYRRGAETLKDAIETYAHELAHFHPEKGDDDSQHGWVESVGIRAYQKYRELKSMGKIE